MFVEFKGTTLDEIFMVYCYRHNAVSLNTFNM